MADEEKSSAIEYRTYSWRFVILFVLLSLQVAIGFQMQEFPSVVNVVAHYYNISYFAANTLGLSGLVLAVIAFYPLTYACEKFGLRDSFTAMAFLCAFGACLKCMALGRNYFLLLFTGQLLQAFSILITLFLTPTVASVCESIEEIRAGFSLILIPAAVFSVLLFLITVMFVKEKPPTPPSAVQKLRETVDQSWKFSHLLKNINFYYLSVIFSLMCTSNQVLLLTLNRSVLLQFEHGEKQLSVSGFLLCGNAIFGTIIVKVVTQKFSNYKILNIINSLIGSLFLACYIASLWFKSEILLYLALAGYGICFNPSTSVVADFLFKVSYPFPSGTVYAISFAIN
ncbi:hypothetical protein B4U79_18940, partial [Dinothrombium tinctorium]